MLSNQLEDIDSSLKTNILLTGKVDGVNIQTVIWSYGLFILFLGHLNKL